MTENFTAKLRFVPEKETLSIEFKSDLKKLEDNDIIEAVVGLANTFGGELYIGVEDDGTPENVSLYPHEVNSRLSELGILRAAPSRL